MTAINQELRKDGGVVFLQAQGANAYQTPGEIPVAADAIAIRELEFTPAIPIKRQANQNGRMSKEGTIRGMHTGSFRMLVDLIPSGAVANEWDGSVLFLTGIFDDAVSTPTATTVSGSSSTHTVVDVADASGISAGDIVGIDDSDGIPRARVVTAVDTASAPDNITLEQPLTFVPADTADVTASKTYVLSDTAEETAFTLWFAMTHGGVRLGGCVVNSYKIAWGNDEPPTLEVSGFYREYSQGRPTTLNGGINNSVTTMTVAGTDWKGITKGAILQINAEGGNSAEVVYVTADPTSASVSIERDKDGGGADAHGDAAVVIVYQPTPTLAGSSIAAKGCHVEISEDDSVVSVRLVSESGSLSADGGVKERVRGHGDANAIHGYVKSSDLSVKSTFSTWAEKDTWDWYYRHVTGDVRPVTLQFGETPGAIFAVTLARQVFELPKLSTTGDDHVGAVLETEDRGSRTGTVVMSIASL